MRAIGKRINFLVRESLSYQINNSISAILGMVLKREMGWNNLATGIYIKEHFLMETLVVKEFTIG